LRGLEDFVREPVQGILRGHKGEMEDEFDGAA